MSLLATPGCFLIEARRDIRVLESVPVLRGEVRSPSVAPKPIVVVVFIEREGKKLARSYYVRYGSGPFEFHPDPGTTYLFAIEDENENTTWEDGEPVAWYGGSKAVAIPAPAGTEINGLTIELSREVPEGTAELRDMVAAGPGGNPAMMQIHHGDIASLGDARFSEESGRKGLWTPVEFIREFGFGVYFLQPYERDRIPVLFVHGAGGAPSEFAAIIDGLDRTRFQPWVLHYPSGVRLSLASDRLGSVLDEVRSHHRFSKLVIVAHSMGGLVSRACIDEMLRRGGSQYVIGFVSISTPWQGHVAAEMGTQRSPVVIPSWFDMVPTSPYLRAIASRPLPPEIPHYLFFSYEGGKGTDGTVSLASQLAPWAQDGAVETYGFPENHVGILRSPALIAKLNATLATIAGDR